MSCRVVVEMPNQHRHQGEAFNVRIDIGKAVRLFPEEGYGFIRRADGDALYFNSDNLFERHFCSTQ